MGAILPVKQHGERLLSGMAQKPPDDRLGWTAALPVVKLKCRHRASGTSP